MNLKLLPLSVAHQLHANRAKRGAMLHDVAGACRFAAGSPYPHLQVLDFVSSADFLREVQAELVGAEFVDKVRCLAPSARAASTQKAHARSCTRIPSIPCCSWPRALCSTD